MLAGEVGGENRCLGVAGSCRSFSGSNKLGVLGIWSSLLYGFLGSLCRLAGLFGAFFSVVWAGALDTYCILVAVSRGVSVRLAAVTLY